VGEMMSFFELEMELENDKKMLQEFNKRLKKLETTGENDRLYICWGLVTQSDGKVIQPTRAIYCCKIPSTLEEYEKEFNYSYAQCTVFEVIMGDSELIDLSFLINPDEYTLKKNKGVKITMYKQPWLYSKANGWIL